jgi:hypothetical protein
MENINGKLKTGILKIIKTGLRNILGNFPLFVFPILVGYVIIFLINFIQDNYQNIYIEILKSLFLSIIVIGTLTFYCLKYLEHRKINPVLLLKIFIISFLHFIYSNIFTVLVVMNIILSPTLVLILQYIGLSIFALFTINIILNNGLLGIKKSFSLLSDNILFFIKMHFIFFFFQLFIIIISGVILRGILKIEASQKLLPYIGLFMYSIFTFFIMIFVKENNEVNVKEN